MRGRVKLAVAGALVAGAAVAGTVAMADGGHGIRETLTGYQEDPLTLSTTGTGDFQASIKAKGDTIRYRLSYADLGNGPAGTQEGPAPPATITGTITAKDVIGPVPQGIAAGEFGELTDAVRAGVTYVNVHSSLYPGGEIRAQLEPQNDDQ